MEIYPESKFDDVTNCQCSCYFSGILKLHEDILLNMDFIHLAQFLTRLPENISSDELFQALDSINMTIDKRKFSQVLSDITEQNKPDS
jgi:hypothetical protein